MPIIGKLFVCPIQAVLVGTVPVGDDRRHSGTSRLTLSVKIVTGHEPSRRFVVNTSDIVSRDDTLVVNTRRLLHVCYDFRSGVTLLTYSNNLRCNTATVIVTTLTVLGYFQNRPSTHMTVT